MADRDQSNTSNRGFASMDERKQQEIASKGGQASGGNFKNDPARAAEAGRKGGHDVPAEERSFSKDHELAAEAGRKGGEHSHGAQGAGSHQDSRSGGQHGGAHQGSFADDRGRASEAGRKGGEHSHDKR
ncbi:MAG: general stress protein [Stellaceae bacterium]